MPPTVTTTYHGPPRPRTLYKPFTWSYSRLKNWRACPLKHYMNDLVKAVPAEKSRALEEGNAVHAAVAEYINGKKNPLPPTMRGYQPEIDRVMGNDPLGTLWLVEKNLAITRSFEPCDTFDPLVWMRAKCDFVKVYGPVGIAIDWKTGQIKEEQEQLALMAQCVFSAYDEVQKIRTQYVWLGNNATTTVDFTREDLRRMWQSLMPEIERYETAYVSGDFPPRPSGLCKRHCNVTSCQYYGKGSY